MTCTFNARLEQAEDDSSDNSYLSNFLNINYRLLQRSLRCGRRLHAQLPITLNPIMCETHTVEELSLWDV